MSDRYDVVYGKEPRGQIVTDEGIPCTARTCVTRLNRLTEENEQLKQFISKIDFAIIRKYDNSLENLLDEIYDSEYNNWIEKQLLRAKKLNGDVE